MISADKVLLEAALAAKTPSIRGLVKSHVLDDGVLSTGKLEPAAAAPALAGTSERRNGVDARLLAGVMGHDRFVVVRKNNVLLLLRDVQNLFRVITKEASNLIMLLSSPP